MSRENGIQMVRWCKQTTYLSKTAHAKTGFLFLIGTTESAESTEETECSLHSKSIPSVNSVVSVVNLSGTQV
jgi:hypothetical protein